mmetsp:Transcript_23743/g.27075  ORF Transcript_23743/g.27075 Transcript_23743/m.27075 type:complete len:802 (+) Transcript_23743:105-2510(+)
MNFQSLSDRPFDEEHAIVKEMKLSEAQSVDEKAKLRASNLDDLANAFQDESPLDDTDDSPDVSFEEDDPYVPTPQDRYYQKKDNEEEESLLSFPGTNRNDVDTNRKGVEKDNVSGSNSDEKKSSIDEESEEESVEEDDQEQGTEPEQSPLFQRDSATSRVQFGASTYFEGDPEEGRNMSQYQEDQTKQESQRTVIMLNGYEYNTPPRNTMLAALLIILAAIGLAIAIISPRGTPSITGLNENSGPTYTNPCPTSRSIVMDVINTTVDCEGTISISPAPTQSRRPSPSPTKSHRPTPSPVEATIYDDFYTKAREFIITSNLVTDPSYLSVECKFEYCTTTKSAGAAPYSDANLTIHEKALSHLLSKDEMFWVWLTQDRLNERAERAIQRYIMTLFSFSTGAGETTNWPSLAANVDDSDFDVCQWKGVICSNRPSFSTVESFKAYVSGEVISTSQQVEMLPMVTSIDLENNNLKGTLPPEIFMMRHLEELKLPYNELAGTLPSYIGLMTNLRKLWLAETKLLSGSIPVSLGALTNLESLYLSNNMFSGSIPKEIENLTNLETLALHRNKLVGKIPDEVTKCQSIKKLYLDDNDLFGTIPFEIGLMTELRDLRVHNNRLSGTIPYSISQLQHLRFFYAYNNQLQGRLADAHVVGLAALEKIELFNNKLTGTISSYLGQLSNLVTIDLRENQFDSTIPSTLCDKAPLEKLDLDSNKITGEIPSGMSKCTKLVTCDLSNNMMGGNVPVFLADLEELSFLDLRENNFNTPIPAVICDSIDGRIDGQCLYFCVPPDTKPLFCVSGDTK